jgi:hypothetical protein
MESLDNVQAIKAIRLGLNTLADRLPESKKPDLCRRIVKAVEGSDDLGKMYELSQALLVMSSTDLSPASQRELGVRMVNAMRNTKQLKEMKNHLNSNNSKLPDDMASQLRGVITIIDSDDAAELFDNTRKTLSNREREFMDDTLGVMKTIASPDCGALAPMIQTSTIPMMIEVLKWPTCSDSDRNILMEGIGIFTKQKFSSGSLLGFVADRWEFIEWARSAGYDVVTPPKRPSRIVSKSE